jgi:hypothetical protein
MDVKSKFPRYSVGSNKTVMWSRTNTTRTAGQLARQLVQTANHNSISRLGCSETASVVINGLYVEHTTVVLRLSKSFTFR